MKKHEYNQHLSVFVSLVGIRKGKVNFLRAIIELIEAQGCDVDTFEQAMATVFAPDEAIDFMNSCGIPISPSSESDGLQPHEFWRDSVEDWQWKGLLVLAHDYFDNVPGYYERWLWENLERHETDPPQPGVDTDDDGEGPYAPVEIFGVVVPNSYLAGYDIKKLNGFNSLPERVQRAILPCETLVELLRFNGGFYPSMPLMPRLLGGDIHTPSANKEERKLSGLTQKDCRLVIKWLREVVGCTAQSKELNIF